MLLVLAILVGLKFALLPLVSWQNAKIDELSFNRSQLAKIDYIASSGAKRINALGTLRKEITVAEDYFYLDDDSAKLAIQRDLEELFVRNNLIVTGFNWVIDSPGAIRSLRATLFFKGPTKNMVATFWKMGMWPKVIRIVEWSQQIQNYQKSKLGSTQGFVTLEFYALNPMNSEADILAAEASGGKRVVGE